MPYQPRPRANLPTRQRQARERGAAMLALYESGLTQAQIGAVYGGISQAAVSIAMTLYSDYVPRHRGPNKRVEAGEASTSATEGSSDDRTSVS